MKKLLESITADVQRDRDKLFKRQNAAVYKKRNAFEEHLKSRGFEHTKSAGESKSFRKRTGDEEHEVHTSAMGWHGVVRDHGKGTQLWKGSPHFGPLTTRNHQSNGWSHSSEKHAHALDRLINHKS